MGLGARRREVVDPDVWAADPLGGELQWVEGGRHLDGAVVDPVPGDELIDVAQDGSFRLNMDYFSYHYSAHKSFNRKFTDLFGTPRVHSSDFFTARSAPHRTGETVKVNPETGRLAAGSPGAELWAREYEKGWEMRV